MHGSTFADASGQVDHLVDRHPSVSPERLIAQLRPPPTFAEVSFATYHPDPAEPTQAAAVVACQDFCQQAVQRRAGRRKLFGKRAVLPGVGLYLDGGFGVGKTHLLASAYYQLPGPGPGGAPESPTHPKAFATFGELTQLAGVFGFVECIDLLADYTLLCIDEFELDDPGNTTLISRLLSQLVERCRGAKEQLLGADAPDSASITLLGAGSKLIGGARTAEITRKEVEQIIVSTGFFRAKTTSILGLGQALCDRFGGEVPGRLKDLVSLPGVGRKPRRGSSAHSLASMA